MRSGALGETGFKWPSAGQLMEKAVHCQLPNVPALTLAKEMVEGNFGSVPIVDRERHLLGIVSEFDLLEAVLSGMDLMSLPAGELMKHPFSVSEDSKGEEVLRFLQRNQLIRVPVTDVQNRVVGILARRDLLNRYVRSQEGPIKNKEDKR
jgi:CBS domain-containing protein